MSSRCLPALHVLADDEHDRAMLAHVRPSTWTNPRAQRRYNLVVIGGGTAGLVSALGAAGLGARVALVERAMMGGDCLVHGCVPSKALLRSAHAVRDVREVGALGVRAPVGAGADFAAATLVARHAGDMVGQVVQAMTEGHRVDALARAIAPYPTRGEVWKRLGDAYQRTRLTPGVARGFERWFRWWR